MLAARRTRLVVAVGFAIAVFAFAVAIASGEVGGLGTPADGGQLPTAAGDSAPLPAGWVSTQDLVLKHEALPCTDSRDPINFEIFSAGQEVAGQALTTALRRCDTMAPASEPPANYFSYIYGRCEVSASDDTGCEPPLEIQTWPACQRSLGDYSFEGQPLPYRELPKRGAAEVVEFNFALERRLEVYTKASTIVIFANNPGLAEKAVQLLTPQEKGTPPLTNPPALQEGSPGTLAPPSDGAMEGNLPCQS